MNLLKAKDPYRTVTVNALQPVGRQSIAGTPISIQTSQSMWYGYSINNNDASPRWVQVFFKPVGQVVLGSTAPDKTILTPASGNSTLELENPILAGTGFTVVCMTTETGTTPATAGATGEFFFARSY